MQVMAISECVAKGFKQLKREWHSIVEQENNRIIP